MAGVLLLIGSAGTWLTGQGLTLDFSGIANGFTNAARPVLTAQAMIQSHHPTLSWDGTRRMAGGFRVSFSQRPQTDATFPERQQVLAGEAAYLVTSNLGISGQLAWVRNETDAAYFQGMGLALKSGSRLVADIQISALKGAAQFYNRAFDLRLGVTVSRRYFPEFVGLGLNRTTYFFRRPVLPLAPRSLETHLNYVYGSWKLNFGNMVIIPSLSTGPNLVLFSLEMLKLSP